MNTQISYHPPHEFVKQAETLGNAFGADNQPMRGTSANALSAWLQRAYHCGIKTGKKAWA